MTCGVLKHLDSPRRGRDGPWRPDRRAAQRRLESGVERRRVVALFFFQSAQLFNKRVFQHIVFQQQVFKHVQASAGGIGGREETCWGKLGRYF